MRANFAEALQALLKHEGGFQADPRDPGNANNGMTNLGVTKRVWEEWVGHPVDEKAMRSLTPALVAPLYKAKYWDKVRGDDLPTGVDLAVFDFAVNSGPGRAAKMLQRVLELPEDGVIGPKTLAKAASIDSSKLIADYNDARLAFLLSLPAWDTFGKGWNRRVAEVTSEALAMIT